MRKMWRSLWPAQAPATPAPQGGLAQRLAWFKARGDADPVASLRAHWEQNREKGGGQELIDWLGAQLRLPVLRMPELMAGQPLFDRLPLAECARLRCALVAPPTGYAAPPLRLLLTDPWDTDRIAWARTRWGAFEVALVSDETLDAWLTHCEAGMSALGSVAVAGTRAQDLPQDTEQLSLRQIGGDDSPAVRLVNSTLYDALKNGASDVHLESDPAGLAVKFRLDGVLSAMRRVDDTTLAAQTISRIKVMAQLDIAERRVPQDGRLQIGFEGRLIDVRVSIMPSIHGEDAVLRVLDRQHLAQSLEGLTLAKLGFQPASVAPLLALCRKPHGMLLVTGPTGSGKTTTLYAALTETHNPRDKVVTIEDPVEYQLPGVLQIPVNERKGLTFARGLRSILRHDPDKILVGEIRDAETAQIAVQSALTGHLVFTTVHANNALDVMGRFQQFGIDSYTLASALNGIVAQRLFRKVCPHCAAPDHVPETLEVQILVQRHAMVTRMLKAVGCDHCRGTGYAGRFALGELLTMTPALKALMSQRAPATELQAEAERGGWRSLRELALVEMLQGHTTLEEVDRVAA